MTRTRQHGPTFEKNQISATEAAERVGVDRRTLQRWLKDARDPIPHELSPGGHARIHEGKFRAWCQRHGIRYDVGA
jgi:excisionase family DNA binding protein